MLFRATSALRHRPGTEPVAFALPGVRAVAGGVLVAGARLGILGAPSDAEAAATLHLVARRDLAPGALLGPGTVEALPMSLPAEVADATLGHLDEDRSLAATTSIPRGAVINEAHVRPAGHATEPGAEITVSVPVDRALGGDVRSGERVDLLATYGSGADGFTTPLGGRVLVVTAAAEDGRLGVEPELRLTLRLPEEVALLPIAHAAHADALTVARGDGDVVAAGSFRPEPPTAGAVPS
ncbi:MAG: hypothetical protein AAGK32_06240 [Actinomycetota bacterium]